MTFPTKILITGFVIVLFDALGSGLSRYFRFDYTVLSWGSFLIYAAAGYWGAYRRGFVFGILLGAWTGFVDATVGWPVSMAIGPVLRSGIPPLNGLLVSVVVISVTATGIVFGLAGAGLCEMFKQTKPVKASVSG